MSATTILLVSLAVIFFVLILAVPCGKHFESYERPAFSHGMPQRSTVEGALRTGHWTPAYNPKTNHSFADTGMSNLCSYPGGDDCMYQCYKTYWQDATEDNQHDRWINWNQCTANCIDASCWTGTLGYRVV